MRAVTRTTLLLAIAMFASSLWASTITVGTPTTVTATEGAAFQNQSLLTFTDSGGDQISNFSATINWGDGTSSTGTITGISGNFSVFGAHTYSEEGSYNFAVSLRDVDGSTASVNGSAIVADAPLTGTSPSGFSFSTGVSATNLVGTFTDAGGAEPTSDYLATIDWGDGSTSAGTIAALPTGNFSVTGTHVYNDAGNDTITTTVSDDGGSTATFSTSANVTSAVPEPASLLLTLTGLASLPLAAWRRRRRPETHRA